MKLAENFNETAKQVHAIAKEKGFWDNERNVGELLMLTVSELGEAMEAHRKGHFAKIESFRYKLENSIINDNPTCSGTVEKGLAYKQHFEFCIKDSFEDEIADAIIRLLDLAAGLNIDIEEHIRFKVEYNKTRDRLHGKNY